MTTSAGAARHRFELACDDRSASAGCRDIAALLRTRYGEREDMQGLELALSELLSNIVRHGRSARRLCVRLQCRDDQVRICLADDGPRFNMAATPARLPEDRLATHGRGLWLVHELVDGFRGHHHGTLNVHGLSCRLAPAVAAQSTLTR